MTQKTMGDIFAGMEKKPTKKRRGPYRETLFWLSYDLGISADYESLFRWLDERHAEECGDSAAFVRTYRYRDDFVEYIRSDIQKNVVLGPRVRFYVIWVDKASNRTRGRFLFGRRKGAPWQGFAPVSGEGVEDGY